LFLIYIFLTAKEDIHKQALVSTVINIYQYKLKYFTVSTCKLIARVNKTSTYKRQTLVIPTYATRSHTWLATEKFPSNGLYVDI